MKQLRLRNPIIFSASFNRPNLRYHVLKKGRNIVSDMAQRLIERHHDGFNFVQPGIIYCLSRADCERVAEELEVRLPCLAQMYILHPFCAALFHTGTAQVANVSLSPVCSLTWFSMLYRDISGTV